MCSSDLNFEKFLVAGIGVVSEMAVGADQHMTSVVRVQIEYDIRTLTTMNDMTFSVITRGKSAERAIINVRRCPRFDVLDSVRRPQAIPGLCHTDGYVLSAIA